MPAHSSAEPATVGRPRLRSKTAAVSAALLLMTAGYVALTFPVTTRQGINFEVTTHRLPLYLKAMQFIDRSIQYQQIADEIAEGAVSDADRVLRVFEWTKRRIMNTPEGWPVFDDHILHIVIRGHGVTDQQADVFATLVTYAGVPAFWGKVRVTRGGPGVLLSFARVDGQWRVFDVYNGVIFRTAAGALATLEDLKAHPELIPPVVGSLDERAMLSYRDVLTRGLMPNVPSPLRAEQQMPLARLWYELKLATRLQSPVDYYE